VDTVQELGLENAWVSELIFTSLFVAFVLWTFSPFVFAKKRFYTSLLYSQVLSVLVGATFVLSALLLLSSGGNRSKIPVISGCLILL